MIHIVFRQPGFFSNPFDVIKTRQQLQGELVAIRRGVKDLELKTELKKQPYKSVYQSFRSIIQAEGIAGLQKGLASALAFQFCMNSIRLGTYQTIDNLGWNRRSNGELHPGLCILWGEFRSLILCGFLRRLFRRWNKWRLWFDRWVSTVHDQDTAASTISRNVCSRLSTRASWNDRCTAANLERKWNPRFVKIKFPYRSRLVTI